MKKLSMMLSALVLTSTAVLAKEVVAAPVATVEPTVVVVEKECDTVAAPVSKDYKFVNFSLMHGKSITALGPNFKNTFLNVEIGGRKGAFDFYGFIEINDILQSESTSDLNKNSERAGNGNFFSILQPRLSINDITNTDLSFGPVKEVYLTGYLKAGDDGGYDSEFNPTNGLFITGLGLGSDVQVPWLGTVGLNFYKLWIGEDFNSERERNWDGYIAKANWFKPFYFFDNGTFLSYQGYMEYQFDAGYTDSFRTSDEFQWYNGLSWHTPNYALGYALKYTKNMINAKDGATLPWNGKKVDSTGIAHFVSATYKF